MSASIGSPAPGFALVDTEGATFTLDQARGRRTLVVFIPFPFTGICDGEACTLRDHFADLGALDANVIIITCYPRPANKKWAAENGFGFPVLADFWPHGEVSRRYGVFNEEKGAANRATFVRDADGIVREIVASESLGTPREYAAYVEALNRF
ncbi:MAG: redoxin domain-containing protein [Actinomycetota bacterium]